MKDWVVYAAYRVGSGAVGMLPEWVIRRVGSFIGWLAWLWAGDRKRMAIRHMRRVLGAGADVERVARGMFSAYGRYWAEVFWYRPSRFDEIERHVTIDGLEHLQRAIDAGRPVIVTLPHMGNWEMAATAARRVGVVVTAVAEALANQRVTDWFLDMRGGIGIDIVLTDEGSGVMRRLLGALKEHKVVALLSDRDLSGSGVPVQFFGEATTLPAGPAALALRSGAAILPLCVYFQHGRGHHIVLEPELDVPESGSKDDRIRHATQSLAHTMERQIRRHPEQWHLVQPNWPSDRRSLEGSEG